VRWHGPTWGQFFNADEAELEFDDDEAGPAARVAVVDSGKRPGSPHWRICITQEIACPGDATQRRADETRLAPYEKPGPQSHARGADWILARHALLFSHPLFALVLHLS